MAKSRLLIILEAYEKQLQDHLHAMHEKRQEVDAAWRRLRDIYEGEAAQAFIEAFEASSARLADYNERASDVSRRLRTKIEELRRFESPSGGEGAGL